MNLSRLLQVYLLSSYLYYVKDISPIPDSVFDEVCRYLLDGWDSFGHQHKSVVTKSDLQAGTGYAIQYPRMVILAAEQWILDGQPEMLVYEEI